MKPEGSWSRAEEGGTWMDSEILEKVKQLVKKVGTVYIATADGKGTPHIAASEGMTFTNEGQVLFKAWFCLKTVENLEKNRKLSLAILSPKTREGYQILGEIERIDRGAILDGYGPGNEKKWAGFPQAEHQLLIQVLKVSALTSGPHSDEFIHSPADKEIA
jgi:general stress protein 26